MTFNVYRTTKGRVGEPVQAEIDVTNPRTGATGGHHPDPGILHQQASFPAEVLAGSQGDLKVEIR